MRFPWSVLVLGLACAVEPPPKLEPTVAPCMTSTNPVAEVGFDAGTVYVSGVEATLVVTSARSVACEPGWTAEARVEGPTGELVPVTVSPQRVASPLAPAVATLRFTPPTPGAYFVTIRFEPTIALIQQTIQVARVRGNEAPIVDRMPFDPGFCTALFRTLAGSVICQRGGIEVIRDGGVVESIASGTAFVVGDTVWLMNPFTLERRSDLGQGPLAQVGTLTSRTGFSDLGGFFTETRAIIYDPPSLRGPAFWDGSQFVEPAQRPATPSAFLLGTRPFGYSSNLGAARVCEIGSTDWRIVNPVGVDGDVLWTLDDTLSWRVGSVLAPPNPFLMSTFPTVATLKFPVLGRQTPLMTGPLGEVLTITMDRGTPILERWPAGSLLSADFALLRQTASSVTWVRR